jgi:hypothetical protein
MTEAWGISDTGRAGSTPQHVAAILRGARQAAIAGSTLLRSAVAGSRFAMQPTRRLQVPEKAQSTLLALEISDVNRRLAEAEPHPRGYWPRGNE